MGEVPGGVSFTPPFEPAKLPTRPAKPFGEGAALQPEQATEETARNAMNRRIYMLDMKYPYKCATTRILSHKTFLNLSGAELPKWQVALLKTISEGVNHALFVVYSENMEQYTVTGFSDF